MKTKTCGSYTITEIKGEVELCYQDDTCAHKWLNETTNRLNCKDNCSDRFVSDSGYCVQECNYPLIVTDDGEKKCTSKCNGTEAIEEFLINNTRRCR